MAQLYPANARSKRCRLNMMKGRTDVMVLGQSRFATLNYTRVFWETLSVSIMQLCNSIDCGCCWLNLSAGVPAPSYRSGCKRYRRCCSGHDDGDTACIVFKTVSYWCQSSASGRCNRAHGICGVHTCCFMASRNSMARLQQPQLLLYANMTTIRPFDASWIFSR